jgi:hypothetical protein
MGHFWLKDKRSSWLFIEKDSLSRQSLSVINEPRFIDAVTEWFRGKGALAVVTQPEMVG